MNPQQQQVEIYRPEALKEVLNRPSVLSGGRLLPGLVIELDSIWE